MQIIEYRKGSKPAYVFDESYILDIRHTWIGISEFDKYFQKKILYEEHGADPRMCTKCEISGIGSNWLSQFGRCDGVSLTLDGAYVGAIKYNDGHDVASSGAAWRRIQSASVRVELSSSDYALRISGCAGPVEDVTRPPLKVLTETEKKDFEFNYKFVIPLEYAAQVLNLSESENLSWQNFLKNRQTQNPSAS
jgi:hypothetical protein